MANTPLLGLPDWAASQASPWTSENKTKRMIEACARSAIIEDRDLNAPPGSCADGACYLIASSGSGAWAGQSGKLAVSVGANAAGGWYFIVVAVEGFKLWVRDENIEIRHNGSAWAEIGQTPLLEELANVSIVGVNDGDQLYFDLSAGVWFNGPAGGVGGGGSISGAPWSLVTQWDFALDGAVSQVDSGTLVGASDIMIIGRAVTTSGSGQRVVMVSTNNGLSFYNTSGDYNELAATGVETANDAMFPHTTPATAARSFWALLFDIAANVSPKTILLMPRAVQAQFIGSTDDITNVRVCNSVGGTEPSGTLTGGTIRIWKR